VVRIRNAVGGSTDDWLRGAATEDAANHVSVDATAHDDGGLVSTAIRDPTATDSQDCRVDPGAEWGPRIHCRSAPTSDDAGGGRRA